MDFQNRVGSKHGSGGPTSTQAAALDHKMKLYERGLEMFSLEKDPYLRQSASGVFECILCLTLHRTVADYVAHMAGKKHTENLRKRAAEERKKAGMEGLEGEGPELAGKDEEGVTREEGARRKVTIGRPGHRVTRQKVPGTDELSLLFELSFPEIDESSQPRYRFVSAYEQKQEAPDRKWQYLVIAADPYETVAFKVSSLAVRRSNIFSHWDARRKVFTLQVFFKSREEMHRETERRKDAAARITGRTPRALGPDGRALE